MQPGFHAYDLVSSAILKSLGAVLPDTLEEVGTRGAPSPSFGGFGLIGWIRIYARSVGQTRVFDKQTRLWGANS